MNQGQQGSATWLALIMMFSLALLLLQQQHRQLQQSQVRASDHRDYLQAYQQAASSLSWGLIQPWPRLASGADWWCQPSAFELLHACARPGSRPGQWLVRGKGQSRATQPVLWLYQLAQPLGFDSTTAVSHLILQPQAQGWLDFCPEKEVRYCAD